MLSRNSAFWCIQTCCALHWCIGAFVHCNIGAIWCMRASAHCIGAFWCPTDLCFGVRLTDSTSHWCTLVHWWIALVHLGVRLTDRPTSALKRDPRAEPSVRSWVPQLTLMPYLHIFTTKILLSDTSVIHCQNEINNKDNQSRWKAFPLWAKR